MIGDRTMSSSCRGQPGSVDPMSRDALYMSIGFAVACAQMRAELMATQAWLQEEVAALHK